MEIYGNIWTYLGGHLWIYELFLGNCVVAQWCMDLHIEDGEWRRLGICSVLVLMSLGHQLVETFWVDGREPFVHTWADHLLFVAIKKMSLHCSQLIINFMCNTKYVPYFNKLFLTCSIYVMFSCSLRLGAHVVTPKWISTWQAKLQLRSLPTNKTLVLDLETIWSHVLLIHLINGDHHFPHDCFNTLYDIICSHIVHPAFCIVVFCFCLFPGSKHGNKGQGDALM